MNDSARKKRNRVTIKKVVVVFLVLALALPFQQASAIAEFVNSQDIQSQTDPSVVLNEDVGVVETPEVPADLEKDTEPDQLLALIQEETPLDAQTLAAADEITLFAITETVTTEAAFKTALADASVSTIYLGANISMSAGPSATVANRPLVISGVDPLDPGGTVHTYSDYPSATPGYGGLLGTCVDLTFRDINVSLSNYYGIYNTAASNETVRFDNVTGTGPQFFHYYNASAGSTFIVKDSNLTLGYGYASITGELAEADRVIFQGNVTITRTVSTALNIFYLAGTYASVTVENGAHVTIDNSANTTAGGEIFYTVANITIGNNAEFYCYTRQGFVGSGYPAISVGQYSDAKFIYTGTGARPAYMLIASSFSVGLQSSVLIYDNSSSVYGALYVSGSVTLSSPRSFVVLNAGSAVMGYAEPTSINGTQIKSIRYFSGASQIAGVYDPVNREYIGTDASPFTKWWIQNSPFNVSAGYWPTNAPTAVTTTPTYSGANIPPAALSAGAATTLASNNFGLFSSTTYGYAVEGETDANITLDYYFDGIKDAGRTTTIAPSLLSTLNVSDVALSSTPAGYTLSSTPTSPVLPASAQSLNNTTVNVYYVTDPAQTATINVNYFFNGVHNASEDVSIEPQVLSTVQISDVSLTTTPPGYMLSATPSSPVLPASAQSLNNTTVNVYYVTDPAQTASINVNYFFNGIHNTGYDATISPQVLSTVGIAQVALTTAPLGYALSGTPTDPLLPASALSLSGQTVNVYYVTDPTQKASIDVKYFFDGTHNADEDVSIEPQILSTVQASDVLLATTPIGYMLSTTPTDPVLPASAQSLNNTTVNVYYVTDPAQTASINVNYFFNGIHNTGYDATISPQVLSTVGIANVGLVSVPAGYMLSATPSSPVLPASALSLSGQTVNVYYVTDPAQTASIAVNYFFNGTYNASRDTVVTPQLLSTVDVSQVTLSTVPPGYMLSTTPTDPVLPASAQSLNNTTVNVYYVTDPAQTASINVNYFFNGIHNTGYDATISPQVLSTVGIANVGLVSVPAGYMLSATPSSPVLPASALSLSGQTVNVYYVTDPAQTASIAVNYFFNGTYNASRDTVVTPQLLSTVDVSQVTLSTVPPGYMLSTTPTDPVLPASAQSLNNTTVNVYYVTDPAQTASINVNYFFNGIHNTGYDATISPQVLSAVSIADVGLATMPLGYMLDAPNTSPTLPTTALSLDNTTVNVYYVTDPAQTAYINIAYYFNGVLDASSYTSITPQVLATVQVSEVTLLTVPPGYMLSTTPTDPVLPASAQSLNNTTVNVYYVTDPAQTATIDVNYFFNGIHNTSLDTSIERQALAAVDLADAALALPPPGYMLDATPTVPTLPESAQSLNNTTVNVYYVTDPAQTASIAVNYFFNGTHNTAYDEIISPQLLSSVSNAEVVLSVVPVGYALSAIPTLPVLPASAQSLNNTTVNVYYETDPTQTATINLEYYFDGIHDVGRDTSITRQALVSVGLEDVEIIPVPIGYALDADPSIPILPQTAYSLDNTTVSVYYVVDLGQIASIDIGYYFDGVLNASYSATINPQILTTVNEADVLLGAVPSGYMLEAAPTSPVLPMSAQDLNGTTVNVYYVADPSQTVTINLEYYLGGIHDPTRDVTITPQYLSTVGLSDVALAADPVGYTLGNIPTSPVLPASAQSLDGTTVSIYYVTDADQTATISVGYYFDGILNAAYSTTITPQILDSVEVADVTLSVVPEGYMLAVTPTLPVLPASAESLNNTTVNVYYVTDPAQTATITLNYFFNGAYDSAYDANITPQVLSSVTTANVALATTPVGFMLDASPSSPTLPASAQSLDGTTVNVYYVTNPYQTVTINIAYYLNGALNSDYNATITPQILSQVNNDDVVLATAPIGYMLDATPTSPALPASAQSLSGSTVNVYYVTDPTQTASVALDYYFNGILDSGYSQTITPQLLSTVGITNVALPTVPLGYTLAPVPTSPVLPASAQSLDGTTVSIYYVTDADQTATISVGYYFDGILNAAYSTTITPQILDSVEVADVTLSVVPEGYMLAVTPTLPVLPASAESLNNTTVNVYYVTDPAQTATITLNYFFNGAYDSAYDAIITPQILSTVGISGVTPPSIPAGYVFAATPTLPVLPASAQTLNNSTVNVYYETDPAQTATITLNYYFNGLHNATLDTIITPQILSSVLVSQVDLNTTPAGYMLATTPTAPLLPASAQSLNNTTVNVYYVTDPAQTASIAINYFFNGTYESGYDVTIIPQVLSTVGISDVSLLSPPIGFMLADASTLPVLPANAFSLDGTTVNVYYETDPAQTATIDINYYLNGSYNASLDTTITPQILSSVSVSQVVLNPTTAGYMIDTPPTVPVLPAPAQALNNTTVNVYYVTDPAQTASIRVERYFNGVHDVSYDQTITPQLLATVGISDVSLPTVPPGYTISSTPTDPALPTSTKSLDGSTIKVYYEADPTQTATITLNYFLSGVHDSSLDTIISPQLLDIVDINDVILPTTPVGYILSTTPTDPLLPESALNLDTTTVDIFYVRLQEQITASNFSYDIALGGLTGPATRIAANVLAYDAEGVLIPASLITVDANQLAAINAAIAAGETQTSPYALTFSTPDGSTTTIMVTLLSQADAESGQGPTSPLWVRVGDSIGQAVALAVTGGSLGVLLFLIHRIRRARKSA